MTDTAQRLKELRERLDEIEWMLAPLELAGVTSRTKAKITGLRDQAARTRSEIARLSEYERLGYDEPNF